MRGYPTLLYKHVVLPWFYSITAKPFCIMANSDNLFAFSDNLKQRSETPFRPRLQLIDRLEPWPPQSDKWLIGLDWLLAIMAEGAL